MRPESIVYYFKWRSEEKGTVLKDLEGQSIIGMDGREMECVGTWKAPINLEQCRSALTCAYENRGHDPGTKHCEPCADCLSLDPDNNYKGFRFHRGQPHLWYTGNPRNSKIFKDFMKRYMDRNSSYIAKGDTALIPDQLRSIRQVLLSTNSLEGFCDYTMILIGCRMFLREEDFEVYILKINKQP